MTPEVLFAFLEDCPGKVHWRISYLRNILRFGFWSGRIPRDLADTIPRSGCRRSEGPPRHLEVEVVGQLLKAIRGDDPRALRDYAMLLLMARLGLRASEVIAIRLDDLDWRAGRMRIQGKGEQCDRMPLPVDVGEALVAWLRGGRKGNSRHLFVCVQTPFAPLTSSGMIRHALCRATRQIGLTLPGGQVRTHSLRHSLAMKLLGSGTSLQDIGDVLRHRCVQSTTVYARYDLEALRPLARPWPVPGAMAFVLKKISPGDGRVPGTR